MNTHIILNRWQDQPDDIGIPRAGYVHHWHLHQDGEPVDAQIDDPDPWGKGAYPVNFDGLRYRTVGQRLAQMNYKYLAQNESDRQPLVLEMEVGQRVFDYRYDRDRLALAHIGRVVRALGGVDCVYGHGWSQQHRVGHGIPYDMRPDLAVYTLIGCPDRLAVSMYGKWDHHWLPDRAHRIERAKRLADAITYKAVRPVLFISPFVAGYPHLPGDMYVADWIRTCEATRTVCEQKDCDAMIWWDGGKERRPYEEARPYVEAAREVLT